MSFFKGYCCYKKVQLKGILQERSRITGLTEPAVTGQQEKRHDEDQREAFAFAVFGLLFRSMHEEFF